MTFIKFLFTLLILIPVALLMWQLVSILISEFTESVKKSTAQERARENALRGQKRQSIHYGRHEEHYSAFHKGHSEREKQQESFGLKQIAYKRKRRKERTRKKDKES